ncbi:sugar nucleotide-binding protein [Haliea sp. E1-2-M8]|uniref:sugar nucleotide-binding protein n=1 Tax=Haliea sp. E1-2-M8 TaxID=3064706 RepID=UPI0027205A03|nr:sugar nucleotide-binding protein [Haliea sp. E1-2-M8]MDO8860638.1 sugar nucleotide-binding protein [Haliea sp. E1-2-M8]
MLLIGSDTSLGLALVDHLRRWGRHELEAVSSSTSRWKSERHAKKVVRRVRADIVVDARLQGAIDSGELINELDIERSHWLAKACQRSSGSYFLLSTARVFSGDAGRAYREQDVPDNTETVGQLLAAAEARTRETCARHVILRLGPVFAPGGTNVLSHMLAQLVAGGKLVLDNQLRGCPVESADAARVVAGILDQLGAGAEAWGTYHYCSPDPTNCYEFAEALLASASQFSEFATDAVQLQPVGANNLPRNRALQCGRIRGVFAIKQVPWRGFVADAVRQYFYQHQQQQSPKEA